MSYDPTVPDLPNQVTVDIPRMNTNANLLNTLFGVDHVPFAPTIATSGYHKKVTFPDTISTPVVSSGEGCVFIKTIAGRTELSYTSSSAETQITCRGLPVWKGGTESTGEVLGTPYTAGPFNMGNGNGQTYDYGRMILPTGIEMKWGNVTPTSNIVNNRFFEYVTPFANRTINVMIQGIKDSSNTHSIYVKTSNPGVDFDKTGFTLRSDDTWSQGFFFFAIGN